MLIEKKYVKGKSKNKVTDLFKAPHCCAAVLEGPVLEGRVKTFKAVKIRGWWTLARIVVDK